MNRDLSFRGVLQAGHDIGRISRANYAERPDLVQAGVAGVKLNEYVVATDIARHEPAQIVLNSPPLLIHAWERRKEEE